VSESQRLPRSIILAVLILVLVLLGIIQAASASFIAAPGTVSALIPRSFGLHVYRALDRVAPAAYVEETLAEDALQRGAFGDAEHYALRLFPGGRRDDLLGRIAEAQGNAQLAREYFFAAPDVDRMQTSIMALAKHDPGAAYDTELHFADRLAMLRTHPDALADAYFNAGAIAAYSGRRAEALQNYERALALAPLDMKYLLNAANEAYGLGRYDVAKRYFARGVDVNPASGDCLAGLGLVALRQGHRDQAQQYAARARAADPHAPMIAALEAALR
jgi:tetratricopeptide (TPR) repeat protein